MARPKDPSKKQLILDCALELFALRGYHAVSVKDIATKAQISLGSMYTYFESKETLINELFRYWKLALMENLGATYWAKGPGFSRGGPISFSLRMEGISPARRAHKTLCLALGAFMRTNPRAFMFLEAQLHADYLDEESLQLERQATEAALVFYQKQLEIEMDRVRPESIQILLSASYGAFVQLFKAHVAGLLVLSDTHVDELEGLLWSMIEGFKKSQRE